MIEITNGIIATGRTSEVVGTKRHIYQIATEIRKTWKNVYFGAVPYLDAMSCLTDKTSKYGEDDAKSIVLYFLSNATTWRGPDAKRIKAELKSIIGVK